MLGFTMNGLNVAAWEVQPLGQMGRRKLKVQSHDEYGGVPFDDPLRF
jgi:hypothetical protein